MRKDESEYEWGSRVLVPGLVTVIVVSAFAPAAAAVPAMSFRGGSISENAVAVGENVTVTASVQNAGDSGGGYTFTFERNRVDFAERRIAVQAQQTRTITETVSFESPGTYEITVNDNVVGNVTVRAARSRVVSADSTQRRIDIRVSDATEGESVTLDIPPSNRTFRVERWRTATGTSGFRQTLTEYSNGSALPVEISGQSTLFGGLTIDSDAAVGESTVRFALHTPDLANTSLDRSEVTVYQRNGTAWTPSQTTVVEERAERVVYDATVTGEATYVVGWIGPEFTVERQTLQSSRTEDGRRLTVNAVINNTGQVTSQYNGTLRVDGEPVNSTRVTVPVSDNASLSLSHEVTAPGTYTLSLSRSDSFQVVLSQSGLGDQQRERTEPEPTATPTQTATPSVTATAPSGTGDAGSSDRTGLPRTVLGISTLTLLGGAAIAVLLFVGTLLLLRRGGGEDPATFEQL